MKKPDWSEPRPKKKRPAADAVNAVIGGKKITEMTADELIRAMKAIAIELERRNLKSQ
jgi:hypothetical protein